MFSRLATGAWSIHITIAKPFSYPTKPLGNPSKLHCAHVLKYGHSSDPAITAATTTCLPDIKTITKPSPSFAKVVRGTHTVYPSHAGSNVL